MTEVDLHTWDPDEDSFYILEAEDGSRILKVDGVWYHSAPQGLMGLFALSGARQAGAVMLEADQTVFLPIDWLAGRYLTFPEGKEAAIQILEKALLDAKREFSI